MNRRSIHVALATVMSFAILNGTSASGPMAFPIDLEWAAKTMHEACSKRAPDLKPSYLERFSAWKTRMGAYYLPYQQWLYDSTAELFPENERSARLAEAKSRSEKAWIEGLKNLDAMEPAQALEACRELSKTWNDPRMDAEIKKMLDSPKKK